MSSHHHDDQHVTETKPVAFTVPLILGLVTMLVILLFVSIGDPCHCEGKCEAGTEHHGEGRESAMEEAHEHEDKAAEAHEETPKAEAAEQGEAHH
jgi:hypothetical protein